MPSGLRPSNKSDLGPSALGGKPNDIVKVLDLTILYDVELSKKKKDCRSVFLLSVFFFFHYPLPSPAFGPQITCPRAFGPQIKSDLGPSALGGKPNDIVKVLDLTIMYDVELSKKKKRIVDLSFYYLFFFHYPLPSVV